MSSTHIADLDYASLRKKVSLPEIVTYSKNHPELLQRSYFIPKIILFGILTFVLMIFIIDGSLFLGLNWLVIVYVVAVALYVLAAIFPIVTVAIREIRLIDFAQKNNLELWLNSEYKKQQHVSELFSMFTSLDQALVLDDTVEVGLLAQRDSKTEHFCTYICIDIGKKVPNIVIDAKINNLFGSDGKYSGYESFDQNLDLEGDFINAFKLYVPKDYKQDALYILTPDVMQILVNELYMYDIELIGTKVYIIKSSYTDLLDKNEYIQLENTINSARQAFSKNIKHYNLVQYSAHKSRKIIDQQSEDAPNSTTKDTDPTKLKAKTTVYEILLGLAVIIYFNIGIYDAWRQTGSALVVPIAVFINGAIIAVGYVTGGHYKRSKK